MGVTRVDQLADTERARFNEWADRWIAIGLRTGAADRAKFEAAVQECYRYAGIPWPGVVVWVPSPLVLALAAPSAALAIELILSTQRADARPADKIPTSRQRRAATPAVRGAVRGAVDGAVGGAVRGAVGGAVDGAVRDAVGGAVRGAVGGAVDGAVDGAVGGAVDGAVRGAVDDAVDGAVGGAVRGAVDGAVDGAVGGAVRGAVGGAVDGAVGGAVRDAVRDAVRELSSATRGSIAAAVRDVITRGWSNYFGGQFWAGYGWYWGAAWTSFFREVCHLDLAGDLWDRGKAYEATVESACWWWPHRRFVMVCERPAAIHRELVSPATPRGWGSHRLHCDTGPAVVWPDGWGVWAIHGVRVAQRVVEAPDTLTATAILAEPNAEVRRIMVTRFGEQRFIAESGATPIDSDTFGDLYRIDMPDDEPLTMVRVLNSTPEPDASRKPYWLRVPPDILRARAAVAWSFDVPTKDYRPVVET